MTNPDALRSITLNRTAAGTFRATNARGGTFDFGSGGDEQFTPVELLLTAIAGCSAIDVDILTSRRSEPTTFEVTAEGEKLRDEQHNHMGPITVSFSITFPDGDDGDEAREQLPRAVELSRDRLCTVSRTVQLGAPVSMVIDD